MVLPNLCWDKYKTNSCLKKKIPSINFLLPLINKVRKCANLSACILSLIVCWYMWYCGRMYVVVSIVLHLCFGCWDVYCHEFENKVWITEQYHQFLNINMTWIQLPVTSQRSCWSAELSKLSSHLQDQFTLETKFC